MHDTALQVVASLLGHVRLSTAQLFWEYNTVQAQPGCMVCREILQRPLAGFMKHTPKTFHHRPGESQGAPQARKASFPPRFAITSTCWHNPSIARIPIRE